MLGCWFQRRENRDRRKRSLTLLTEKDRWRGKQDPFVKLVNYKSKDRKNDKAKVSVAEAESENLK